MKNWIERLQTKLVAGLVGCFGSVVILALWGPAQTASAATIPVTTEIDEYGSGAEACSLREAITAANTDAAFGGCVAGSGSDVVSVPAGVFMLTRAGANEDNNATGDLDIRSALVVSGAGQSLTIVDANQLDRVLHVPVADVDLNVVGLTVQHGLASDSSGGGAYVPEGGAVITSSVFVSNSTALDGGGAFVENAVTVTHSSFISNTSITNTGQAGGLYSNGRILIEDSRFEFNVGSGIFTRQGGVVGHSSIIGNHAFASGGGVAATSGRFEEPIQLEIHNTLFYSNSAEFSGGGVGAAGVVTITDSTFSNNSAVYEGGGLWAYQVLIQDTLFQSNRTLLATMMNWYGGGGLKILSGGVISNTSFISNTAQSLAGWSVGGAIVGNGALTVVNSLFVDNTAFNGQGESITCGLGSNNSLTISHVTIASTYVITGAAIDLAWCGQSLIRNTIITSHTVGMTPVGFDPGDYTNMIEDYNLFYGNTIDRVRVLTGSHSLNGNPAFVNPLAGDFHLRPESAAIGRGIDLGITPDFDGNPRHPGINPDIGYVETPKILIAGLTASNDSPQLQDVPVHFTASTTAGTDVTYQWRFDDGLSGPGAGITTTHVYEVPGIYTATVIATDRFSGTAILTTPVTITVPQNPNLAGALNAEFVGRLVTYTFVVSNPNPVQPAVNVVVSGSISPDTQLVSTNGISVSSGGYYGLGYVTLPTVTLTPTQHITLTWTVSVSELKTSFISRGSAASDTAVIDRRVLVRVIFRKYLPVVSKP